MGINISISRLSLPFSPLSSLAGKSVKRNLQFSEERGPGVRVGLARSRAALPSDSKPDPAAILFITLKFSLWVRILKGACRDFFSVQGTRQSLQEE